MSKKTFLISFLLISCHVVFGQWNFKTDYFEITINGKGQITGFKNWQDGKNYLPAGQQVALLSILKNNTYLKPVSMEAGSKKNSIRLKYANGSVATLSIQRKKTHVRMELLSVEPRNGTEAVVWGPFATTIDDKIGETLGLVRNQSFAIGVQALNIKTVEGLPYGDNAGGFFIEPLNGQQVPDSLKKLIGKKVSVDVNKTGDMPEYVRFYRGTAAVKKEYGSELRFFSRDYRIPRIIPVWEGPETNKQYVEPIDVDFTGSAIAVFGCPEPKTLDVIEKIVLAEGLPYPKIDNVWVKRSKVPGQAYLLNEGDPNKSIRYAEEAGFKLVHMGDFFESWGHFGLKTKRFPNGATDIMEASEAAAKKDIALGVHTLTMFTSANDAYITPVPSDSLAKTGTTILTMDMDTAVKEVFIEDPLYFLYPGRTRTVKIGKELMNYRAVSSEKPWRLLDVHRGAYGTRVSAHSKMDAVDKLTNNVYNGFYPDIRLQQTYAERLAEVCNQTGIGLMDFDGFPHGAASPTGHDNYAAGLFIEAWYKKLDKYRLNCGAGAFHYYWHILSFMNWGEPWYNDLRESQVNYRIENQRYFDRNLMPAMLGWFSLAPTYRPEEVEWIQARSAGFNAGYLIRIDESIEKNGFRDQLFSSIKEWQSARNANVFSPEQRERMKNPKNEFHLEKKSEKSWALYPVRLERGFSYKYKQAQTGEPVVGDFSINNPYNKQPLQFYITAASVENDLSAYVAQIQLKVNEYQTILLNVDLKAGEHIYCDGKKVYHCNNTWKVIKELDGVNIPSVENGNNQIQISGRFSGSTAPVLNIEFKSVGAPEVVGK